MKIFKKIILILILSSIVLIFNQNFSFATNHQVNNQETLVSAIEEAQDGDTIELTDNIVLISPVSITEKNITINGNGHSISRKDTNWSPEGPNGSLLTAGGTGTRLVLKNLTLKDAEKYGVQSYNGAHVVLDNVTAVNNGFGGVLVNAGTIEIINLHLGKNGKTNNNGIEIGKGAATGDKVPELIMNGTISSSESNNVIYIAENNSDLKEFSVKNTDTTTDKILVTGNKVVVTDENNNVLFASNENSSLTLSGEEFKETPTTPVPEPTPEQVPAVKDETPKTGIENNLLISIIVLAISIILTTILKNRKDF